MIREHRPQSHSPCMQNGFMAQTTQARMAMNYLYLLSNDNVPEDGEEREDGWECRCSVDDEKWNMVDFESIRKISDASSSFVCVGDHYDLMSAVDELGRKLVYVAFNSSWLREEEVTDHSNVVRHNGGRKWDNWECAYQRGRFERIVIPKVENTPRCCSGRRCDERGEVSRGEVSRGWWTRLL